MTNQVAYLNNYDNESGVVVGNGKEVNIEKLSTTEVIITTPAGKLMYYFHCLLTTLEKPEDPRINWLRNYPIASRLTHEQKQELYNVCVALPPNQSPVNCLFQEVAKLPDGTNEFHDPSVDETTTGFAMPSAETVVLMDRECKALRYMKYHPRWAEEYYFEAIRELEKDLHKPVQQLSTSILLEPSSLTTLPPPSYKEDYNPPPTQVQIQTSEPEFVNEVVTRAQPVQQLEGSHHGGGVVEKGMLCGMSFCCCIICCILCFPCFIIYVIVFLCCLK